MLELIYPSRPAPLAKGTVATSSAEMLPIVDECGVVLAQAPRDSCHANPERYIHPVVHLHILNRKGEFYLQKRSASKKQFPNMWDTAVGGHISYGEYVREALFREAGEELGFFDFNPIFIESYLFESEEERELISVFVAVGNFTLYPSTDEVAEGRWWTSGEIDAAMGHGVLTQNFEHEYRRFIDRMLALL